MKSTTTLKYNLKRPTVGMDDLKRITGVLKESGVKTSPKFTVVFNDDPDTTINYDSYDEIETTPRRVKELHMRVSVDETTYSSLTVYLTNYSQSIQMYEGSLSKRGIFENVKDTLKPCENKTRWAMAKLEYLFVFSPLILFYIALAAYKQHDKYREHLSNQIAFVALIALILVLVRLYTFAVLKLGRGYTVHLLKETDNGGFFRRNRDAIITQIILGTIFLVTGYFLGKL